MRENLTILRDWGYMDWLMELVTHPTTRPAALRLILHSIKLDTSIENSHGYFPPSFIKTKTREWEDIGMGEDAN